MRHKQAAMALALAVPLAFTVWCSTSALAAVSSQPSSVTATAYRWGVPGSNGAFTQLERTTPTAVTGIEGKVVAIATSNSDSYALTSNGEVWAWGVDNYGELGNGTAQTRQRPGGAGQASRRASIVALATPCRSTARSPSSSHRPARVGLGLNADGDLRRPACQACQ